MVARFRTGGQIVKQTTVAFLALILSFSIWPVGRTALDAANYAGAGATPQFSGARTLLQLAKHNDYDNGDPGYTEDYEHRHKHGRHKKHEGAAEEEYEHRQFCGPYFRSDYVPYFRNYYSENDYANLPPGLRKHIQKAGHLPPGLEKNYERTGQLPPGLQKRFECGQTLPPAYTHYLYPVPDVAYQRVGPLPPDSKLYLYGNDLILLNDHTKAIIDIMRDTYR
jgi:Ni/Co efflux regulator RcnB